MKDISKRWTRQNNQSQRVANETDQTHDGNQDTIKPNVKKFICEFWWWRIILSSFPLPSIKSLTFAAASLLSIFKTRRDSAGKSSDDDGREEEKQSSTFSKKQTIKLVATYIWVMTNGHGGGTITSYASWLLVLDTDYNLATQVQGDHHGEVTIDQGPGIGIALALVSMFLLILLIIYGTLKMMNKTYQSFKDEEFVWLVNKKRRY